MKRKQRRWKAIRRRLVLCVSKKRCYVVNIHSSSIFPEGKSLVIQILMCICPFRLQLEFAVSIDFTASNGPVHLPQSLHFINGQTPNQYEMAIRAVLEICEHYNHSRIFDACGFGAKLAPNFNEVKHLFPLNTHTFQRQVEGVNGVLSAYKQSLASTQLYGPTNFEPTIQEFAQKARSFPKDGTRYQILLIITDGVITDMLKTKLAIVNASDLPLSIIIVGVGSDSFDVSVIFCRVNNL
jgi:hypothetical protein